MHCRAVCDSAVHIYIGVVVGVIKVNLGNEWKEGGKCEVKQWVHVMLMHFRTSSCRISVTALPSPSSHSNGRTNAL